MKLSLIPSSRSSRLKEVFACNIKSRISSATSSARVMAVPGMLLLLADQALAQSLKQTGVSIFEVIYSIVGVIGAIACLVTLLNWVTGNWLGRDDPRKLFFQGLLGTGLAFSVVAIVQFVKDAVGGSASGISSL